MATETEILTKLNDLLSTYDAALSVDGGSKLLTLDRGGSGDTAAVVIQQVGAERWRLGQIGADAFALQRSPSGAAVDYTDVLSINRSTGAVTVTGNMTLSGNQQSAYLTVVNTYPGLDLEDTNGTGVPRVRFVREGPSFSIGGYAAGAGSFVATLVNILVDGAGATNHQMYLGPTIGLSLNTGGLYSSKVYSTTTASAANLNVASNGLIARSTSSLQYKTDVEPADRAMLREMLLAIEPIWYRSLCNSDDPSLSWWGIAAEALAEVDPRFVTFRTVEEIEETYTETWSVMETDPVTGAPVAVMHEQECTRPALVDLDRADWVVEGVAYERLTVALISVVQDQQAAIADLTARVAVLEAA